MTPTTNELQDFIAVSRYSRYRPDLGRREIWPEAVARVRDMHLKFFSHLEGSHLDRDITRAFDLVEQRRILPSMRSIQFGGDAILKKHGRIFNCSFSFADRPRFFAEAFYMLLCGTGVGFSVQRHHVEKLPPIAPRSYTGCYTSVTTHVIGDTIEGWADGLDMLFRGAIFGFDVNFDFSQIRPEGAALKTAGGKAPGPEPLRLALEKIAAMLKAAAGRKLTTLEVYDIVMHTSQAVLSGGVRRSATICLFSADDMDMANAKTGNWFVTHPQRAFSNNSAILVRDTATRVQFDALFDAQKQFGEPGFYFSSGTEYGANPCVEIGLNPVIDGQTGWQMCNLSTINGAAVQSPDDFYWMCWNASLIGTLQAAYTNIEYLGETTRKLNDREALLGVSICGIMDKPSVLLDPTVLRRGAEVVRDANAHYARVLGIRRAARTTCVKPEGTASLLLGAGSGIHPHHARRYFRRVQNSVHDPVYRHFQAANPHMCERSVYDQNGRTDVITFPVEAGANALVREDVSAIELLKAVKLVQENWVRRGTAYDTFSPGLEHNVSNTVTVRPEEWPEVREFIWANREFFTGIALLQDLGDKAYAQAPREAVADGDEMLRWAQLKDGAVAVDYTAMRESQDNTALKAEPACAGGACEISR